MQVELFSADDRERMAEATAIRTAVFVEEQGVPADEELDEHDRPGSPAVHALVRSGERAVAAGRFYRLDDRTVQIGRMAVLAAHRGRGLGRAVLDALAGEARSRTFTHAHLHAQIHATEFYRSAGFVPDGEPLMDAGILHQPMTVTLEDYESR